MPETLRSSGAFDLAFMRAPFLHGPFLHGQGARRATHVHRAAQSGCLRLRVPREEPRDEPCVVVLNTAGGLAEGDRLEQRVRWGADARASVVTLAAEKVYRALAEGARVSTRIEVERGAHAEWLPQETILFDRSRLRREARIILAEDVSFLGVEAVVLGRQAMGETLRQGELRDRMRIWRGGRLIYADTLALDGEVAALMKRAAVGGGCRAMAVLVHASDGAARLLDPVRDALAGARGRAAASTWNGLLAVRLLAPDGETLRHDIAAALLALRQGRPLPRVWKC